MVRSIDLTRTRAHAQLAAIVESSIDAIITTALDGTILRWNPGAERTYGYSADEAIGRRLHMLAPAECREELSTILHRVEHGEPVELYEAVRLRNDGTRIEVAVTATAGRDEAGTIVAVSELTRDITDRKQAVQDQRRWNAWFQALVEIASDGILVLDGDGKVVFASGSIERICGEPPEALLGRHWIELIHPDSLGDAIQGIVLNVRDLLTDTDATTFATASIGNMTARPGDPDPEALLRDATTATCGAKDHGRDPYEPFESSLYATAVDRHQLTDSLRSALPNDELRLHYQPIMRIEPPALIGFEALLRWERDGELLPPDQFIPIAEQTGLIIPIGTWVLEQACQRAATWSSVDGAPAPTVAVNLSVRQLHEPDLPGIVSAIITATGLDPSRLALEITESLLADDVPATLATLDALRMLGVHLVMDDFGTGYSSLAYLKRFPVDALKIDRTFIDGLGQEPEDSAIVAAIITLARTLGLTTVAEGVETQYQLDELRRLGCDAAQGYHFGHPAPLPHSMGAFTRSRVSAPT